MDVGQKRVGKPAKKVTTRSAKTPADLGADKRYRGQAQADRLRRRQIEQERPDRGGPQGRKDKDFQRKH
jgi:hypothetical protein